MIAKHLAPLSPLDRDCGEAEREQASSEKAVMALV